MNGVTVDEARLDLARRHGFESWDALTTHVEALRDGSEPPPPFMLAYRAVEEADEAGARRAARRASRADPGARDERERPARNGRRPRARRLLLERGADPNRGNDYGWTKLHQAGYSNRPELAQLMLDAGGRLDLSARGDGGTPLIAALFWGHREVVPLLGLEPGNLRVAAGLGLPELIDELAGTPRAGAHRAFYRPHGGFPAWEPSDDPQEVLDEALVWAAKADRVDVLPQLVGLGARVEADPYRGTAADLGRRQRPRRLDPEARRSSEPTRTSARTFGGPDHGEGRDCSPPRRTVRPERRGRGAARARRRPDDPDALYDSTPAGWADFGGHAELAARLRDLEG